MSPRQTSYFEVRNSTPPFVQRSARVPIEATQLASLCLRNFWPVGPVQLTDLVRSCFLSFTFCFRLRAPNLGGSRGRFLGARRALGLGHVLGGHFAADLAALFPDCR